MKLSPFFFLLLAGCLGPTGGVRPLPQVPPPPTVDAGPLSPDGVSLTLVPAERFPVFKDDGGLRDLKPALEQSLAYYRSLPVGTSFLLGPERVTAARMASSVEALLALLELPPDVFQEEVRRRFNLYQSPGTDNRGTLTFSSYYEHALDAAFTRGGIYQYPIYGRPPDLLEVDDPRGKTMSRREKGKLVPYYSRREIDLGGVLEGKGLEIAWAADPLDIFFLQVQGSGWLQVPGEASSVRVRFAGHNGLPYVSVGGQMIAKGIIPKDQFSRRAMVEYFRDHREERLELLSLNPRYVFFRLDRGADAPFAIGSIRRPLTPRRSVAADKAIFPPGAIAWMETEKPRTARFVLVQDEGGAIKGPGRIDYFVGAGKEAENYAVAFWTPGRFYILLLK
jgi:membrane-bound lytic murein transglycosylase A